jgi:hypothetical protein
LQNSLVNLNNDPHCKINKKIPLAFVFVDEIDAIGRQTTLLLERRDSYLHEAEYLATTKS